jgi:xylan 1,4-beta-xylosidase
MLSNRVEDENTWDVGRVTKWNVRRLAFLTGTVLVATGALVSTSDSRVDIRVNTHDVRGPLAPIWAWFGNDEPNYAYMRDGQKLLDELADLGPATVHFRTHNLLTSGDGTAALKWGSTNVYTEDANGTPVYDWTILDRILDTYAARHVKPLFQLGFMPEALSTGPPPYRHAWTPGGNVSLYTGWSYPPRDYAKWGELIYQVGKHVAERYGVTDVQDTWLWEVWNEPDIGYWHGTPEEFMKLYDYAADGLRRALPRARIGGPEVTGPNGARTQTILRNFLEHCLRGTNYATGTTGSPLDFITFHAKGAPQVMPDGHVRMNVGNQLRAVSNGFGIVASFPELKSKPIVIGESDPEGCAACPVSTNPANAYRNGTMYSSYTAEQLARTYELADRHGVNLLGAVTWAFEFEDQPSFAGFRDLATNGIDKPVLNVFRMLGKMTGRRVRVESTGALPLDDVRDGSVRAAADVNALAAADAHSTSVLVWNYHDDDLPGPAAAINLTIDGVDGTKPHVTHYRVDDTHSNAYTDWKRQGSPQPPSDQQTSALVLAGHLETLPALEPIVVKNHQISMTFTLPRQGVSLLRFTW